MFLRIIVQGFEEEDHRVDENADGKKSSGKEVQKPQQDPSLVKLVDSQVPEKDTKEKCNPFIFHFRPSLYLLKI